MDFSENLAAEWKRLNPTFKTPSDTMVQTFKHSFQEDWHSYFAPIKLLWWFTKMPFKKN